MRVAGVLAIVGSLFLGVPAAVVPQEGRKTELEGTYTVVKAEKGGKEVPAERVAGSVVYFRGDKVVGQDKDRKEFFAATFKLDTSSKPHKIHMTSISPSAGQKASGIIEVKGDTLRLCYSTDGAPEPTSFKTKEENQHSFVLERQAK